MSSSSKKVVYNNPPKAAKSEGKKPSQARQDMNQIRAEIHHLFREITKKVNKNPEKAALILADWINPNKSRKK